MRPIRPIVKIGLIAPFEGLYRESGYAALEGMRQAMVECAPPSVDVLPLALDDSGDPAQAQRAAQKLLVDPSVRAIVGPLLFDLVPAVTMVIPKGTDLPWYISSLVRPEGGFADPQTDPQTNGWLNAQVDYVAAKTAATRVLVLGLPPAWQVEMGASVPIVRNDDLDSALATVRAGDALLWLGRPDVGARWLAALREQQPNVEFWLANQAGIDLFVAHTTDLDGVHWLLWTDSNYNQWSQTDIASIRPNDDTRYLTYRATCDALNGLVNGSVVSTVGPVAWELHNQPIE